MCLSIKIGRTFQNGNSNIIRRQAYRADGPVIGFGDANGNKNLIKNFHLKGSQLKLIKTLHANQPVTHYINSREGVVTCSFAQNGCHSEKKQAKNNQRISAKMPQSEVWGPESIK